MHSLDQSRISPALNPGEACVPTIRSFALLHRLIFVAALVIAATATVMGARAADARHGKRLAQSRCAACHIVAPHARSEVAEAPPFDVIGRKYGFNVELITHAILGPHPKMNFSPAPSEAGDIAAYIATLGQ
jgi:cytochrome c